MRRPILLTAIALCLLLAACVSHSPDRPAGAPQVRPADGMTMLEVPAGKFIMGMDVDETMALCTLASDSCSRRSFKSEEPVRSVTLSTFWIDQTEVTNGMYALCTAAGACQPPRYSSSYYVLEYYGNPQYDDFPVMNVSWNAAQAYCTWAGVRLPTEAEWEKAARGTDERKFPWGDGLPDETLAVYFHGQENADTAAAGSHPAGVSPYGALDMAGNVMEWVADWYDEGAYRGDRSDPQGPKTGEQRIHRGGGISEAYDLLTSRRGMDDPEFSNFFLGFRCAASP